MDNTTLRMREELQAGLTRLEEVERRVDLWKASSIFGLGKVCEDMSKQVESVQTKTVALAKEFEQEKVFRDKQLNWVEVRLNTFLHNANGEPTNDPVNIHTIRDELIYTLREEWEVLLASRPVQ